MIKGDIILDAKYKLSKVVETMCDTESRKEWDSTVNCCKLLKKYSPNVMTYYYIVNIPVFMMQNREFVEKRVVFRWKDAVYTYTTSIDDSFYPLSSSLTRGKTIFSGTKVVREGGKIVVRIVTQTDFKVSMPTFIMGGKIADGLSQFRKELIARLDSSSC